MSAQGQKLRQSVLDGMKPLYAKAEKTGQWLFLRYQGIWFSPEELKDQQAAGNHMWGAANWTLRDPEERAEELRLAATSAQADMQNFGKRLAAWRRNRG